MGRAASPMASVTIRARHSMNHLQNQTNNRQKPDGLRQALNGEVNVRERPLHKPGRVSQR
jgi:hypothetical protein